MLGRAARGSKVSPRVASIAHTMCAAISSTGGGPFLKDWRRRPKRKGEPNGFLPHERKQDPAAWLMFLNARGTRSAAPGPTMLRYPTRHAITTNTSLAQNASLHRMRAGHSA